MNPTAAPASAGRRPTPASPEGARRAVERWTPTGRIVAPAEVAQVLRFLISGVASGLSGAAVTADGGLSTANDYANPES